jgi:hypothetical protein
MGLMDKVRAQATVLAQKTQETARDSKAKLDQVQARRRADAMLRDLGTAVYAERTGRSTTDTDAKIEKLVADLAAYETEQGVNLTDGSHAEAPASEDGDSAGAAGDSASAAGDSAGAAGGSGGTASDSGGTASDSGGTGRDDTGTTQV